MNPLSQSARRVELEYSESENFGANGDLVPSLEGILEDITSNTASQPPSSMSSSGPPRRWWPFRGLRRPRIDRVHPDAADSFIAGVELGGGLPIGLNLVPPPRQQDLLPEDLEGRSLGACDLKAATAWFELARALGFAQASTLIKASNISAKVLVSV
jgi:hypothetical protein